MATTIQIKRGTGSAVPSSLAEGELAINLDNGKLYFGQTSTSASSAFRFDTITAENYVVSSSVTNITTQTLSGSTAFGDSVDDTHTFTGNITASGDISASDTSATHTLGGTLNVMNRIHTNRIDHTDLSSAVYFGGGVSAADEVLVKPDGSITSSKGIQIADLGEIDFVSRGFVTSNARLLLAGGVANEGFVEIASGSGLGTVAKFFCQGDGLASNGNKIVLGSGTPTNSRVTIDGNSGDALNILGDVSASGNIEYKHRVFDTGSTILGSNGGSMGDIVKFGGSSTTAGLVYYLKNDGTWHAAQADSVTTATSSLAVAVGSNSTTDGMLLRGFIHPQSDPTLAGIGNPLYLSDLAAGRMIESAPSSTNDVVRIVGYRYGTDVVYFNPSNDYIVHS